MKKTNIDVNLLVLIFAIALFFSSCDRVCAVQGDDNLARLYFFTTQGCRPCKQVEPILRGLAEQGFPITKIDSPSYPLWVAKFQVTSYPTVVLVKDNRELIRHSGLINSQTIESWFQQANAGEAKVPDQNAAQATYTKSQIAAIKANDKHRNQDTFDGDKSTLHRGTRIPKGKAEQLAMDATVRIRVEDPEGISFATGTIIHSHEGEWLVMTCGHVFRDSQGSGEITVEYDFQNGTPRRAPGKVLSFDAGSRDIGLIAVNAGVNATPVPLELKTATVDRGKDVFSIGCDHGEEPTIRRTRIKRKARYDVDLITKYDIYGRPVDGRSGGGLFSAEGKLVGICNAAAVDFDEGIYTALDTIYWQIAEVNLQHLFQNDRFQNGFKNREQFVQNDIRPSLRDQLDGRLNPADRVVQVGHQDAESPKYTPFKNDRVANNIAATPKRYPKNRFADNRPITQVDWTNDSEGSSNNPRGDMEVILIVRSKKDPTRTEAITLADPSPKLLNTLEKIGNRLNGESRIDMAQLRKELSPN